MDVDEVAVTDASAAECFPIHPDCRNMTVSSFLREVIGTMTSLTSFRTSLFDFGILGGNQSNLFQLPTLRKLDLTLRFRHVTGYDVQCQGFKRLANIISEMTDLEHLAFRGAGHPALGLPAYAFASGDKPFSESFSLQSSSLRTFSVEGQELEGFMVRKCICPKLEHFTCCRFQKYGNGVRPDDSWERYRHTAAGIFHLAGKENANMSLQTSLSLEWMFRPYVLYQFWFTITDVIATKKESHGYDISQSSPLHAVQHMCT